MPGRVRLLDESADGKCCCQTLPVKGDGPCPIPANSLAASSPHRCFPLLRWQPYPRDVHSEFIGLRNDRDFDEAWLMGAGKCQIVQIATASFPP
jgi:hypothetical protein